MKSFLLLAVITILFLLLIYVLYSIAIMQYFCWCNKAAMDEYAWAKKEVAKGNASAIEHKLRYTKLLYTGMIADSDKLHVQYRVMHPYNMFLKDRATYGATISSWSQDVFGYRGYETEPPPPSNRPPNYTPTKSTSDTSTLPDQNIYIPFVD